MIRIRRRFCFLLLIACTSLSCAGSRPHYDYAKEPNPTQRAYVLGISDQLRIIVWKNAELSADVVIRPDGTITLPLVGDLKASGRTTEELKQEIKQRISAYVKDEAAVVTVAVSGVESYQFTVAGNVAQSGIFSPKQYVTVAEGISMAGGPNRFSSDIIYIIRRDKVDAPQGRIRKIPVNYKAVISGEAPEQNLIILPGDMIYVP